MTAMERIKQFFETEGRWKITYQNGKVVDFDNKPIEYEYIGESITLAPLDENPEEYCYTSSWDFSYGLCPIRINGKWGFVDDTLQTVIIPVFDFVGETIPVSRACWRPEEFIHSIAWENGHCRAKLNGTWIDITENYSANEVIPNKNELDPLIIVDQCYNRLPDNIKNKPWEVTDHGRKVLQTEDELNGYIAAYGEMHIIKCKAALQNFPFEDLELYSYDIYDWGCGQGLATLTLLSMLQERRKLSHLGRIFLIEPSMLSLKRATNWVKQYVGPGIEVISINKYIPNDDNASMPEVFGSSKISINLFSNILDIRNLSLSWLANKTASLANKNYMICVGPKFTQNTNTRIADFCGYFKPDNYFSDISKFPYSYTTRTHHVFGCETKCFVHNSAKAINLHYQECATEDVSSTDPYDYAAEVLHGIVEEPILLFYNHLRRACEDSYNIFFRPAINCDTADFVLVSKTQGVVLINVCDSLSNIEKDFSRIEAVKDNLFNVHLKKIKIDSIMHPSVYNCIKTALYFPNHSHEQINEEISKINNNKNSELDKKNDDKHEKDYFAFLKRFTKSSNLKEELSKINTQGFKNDYYEEIVSLISSKWHSYKDGDLNFSLSQKQKEIVRSESKRIRIKGVAGCGKTQVVANRAVEQHLKTGDRVLIITFNISLIQYIRMRIIQVPADFSHNMFEIVNYHQFFRSKAKQYDNRKITLTDYDNSNYFLPYKNQIQKYKSIIIDEAQDFKESWLQLIINNFLSEDGSVSIFGDGEQNIYERELEKDTKMPPIRGCGFSGRWNEMSERISMRILNPQIASLSSKFANTFLENKSPISIQDEFLFEEYYIKYWLLNNKIKASTLVGNILWIMKEYHLNAHEVVVLGQSINLLRDIEEVYAQATNQPPMINFETQLEYKEVNKKSSAMYIQKDLDKIRQAAKTHFTTSCDNLKISTIHSFKGWESKTVILILQPEMKPNENYDGYKIQKRDNTPALIYTALTRAKCNLFILNLNNVNYHSFFNNNIPQ